MFTFGRMGQPLPPAFVLTDRDDGTEWLITHRSSDERIGVTDDWPRSLNGFVRTFGAYTGPVLADYPTIRLLIRGGKLGYEIDALPGSTSDRDQPPVSSRDGFERFAVQIIPAGWANEGDTLGWTVVLD